MSASARLSSNAAGGLLVLCVAVAFCPSSARGQAPADSAAPRQLRAVRIDGRRPTLDGRLDEEVWRTGVPAEGFTQKLPTEGAAASERTEVRLLYDSEALYVGARMWADSGRAIQAPLSRRDAGSQAEHLLVSLDTYRDRRTAYTFGVTAAGTRLDWYHPNDDERSRDPSWDPVWEAHVARDSSGWTAEMRIPLSQLRFNPGSAQTWGINLQRFTPSKNEHAYWILVPAKTAAWASRFGALVGIAGVRPTRRIELSPYIASGLRRSGDPEPGNPFDDGTAVESRMGGDLKVGLGSNLTLDATFNPDFGQVELDPAEVNLSAFETFFPERRPFFTEGAQLLSGGGVRYFYSRRIGSAPRGRAEGDRVDRPDHSTILGAVKVTGRLPAGTSGGVLAAVTAREWARVADDSSGVIDRVEVGPRTGYAVGRVQQEFGRSGSTFGGILTATYRDVEAGAPLASLLPRAAYAGGLDGTLRLGGGTYEVGGRLGFSHVEGDSAAILGLQRSSARYFQRPDAAYVELDPRRRTLNGFTTGISAAKISGAHWLWETGIGTESPGFELNDAGRLANADGLFAFGQLRYRETQPRGILREYELFVTSSSEWNYGAVRTGGDLWLDANATWKNRWRSEFSAFVIPRGQDDLLTRGGPLAGTLGQWSVIGTLANRSAAPMRWRARVFYGQNFDGVPIYRLSGGVSVRRGPRWQLSVDPNFLRLTPQRQFVARVPGGPTATFGQHYVFAAVERSEFVTQLRLAYLLTPDLSLEGYAEPFASSGRYHNFGYLHAAGAQTLTPADQVQRSGDLTRLRVGGRDLAVRDFNVRSFRSNAVLRWEWRPGSTLFVVWQQDRGQALPYQRVGPGSLFEGLGATGDNLLLIKASYWLPLR